MPQLLKDNQVIDNTWQLLEADQDTLPSGDILVPLSMWQNKQSVLEKHSGAVGLWIDGNEEVEALADLIATVP